MTFDNWQTVASIFFCMGMGAGLVLAVLLAQIFWKISAIYCTAEAAARVAEKSLQEAQIRVNERMLAEQRERLRRLFALAAETDVCEPADSSASLCSAEKAVAQ